MAGSSPGRAGKQPTVPFWRSLRWRLLVLGFVVWGVSVGLPSYGAIRMQQAALESHTLDHLAAVALARAGEVRTVVRLVTRQVEKVAALPELQAALTGRGETPTAAWLRTRIISPVLPIEQLSVLDMAGATVLATRGSGGSAAGAPGILPSEITGTTYHTPSAAGGEAPYFEIIVPIRAAGPSGAIIGCLHARLDIGGLHGVLLDRTSLGESGEVYLAGPDQRIISPVRHPAAAAELRYDTWPARAAQDGGQVRAGAYPGYRGGAVVGAAAAIPELGWLLVAEIDQGEAMAPVRRLTRATLGLVALAAELGIAVTLVLSAQIIRPLRVLNLAAAGIAAGRWEMRVPVQGQDELGALSATFNRMAAAVAGALAGERAEKESRARLAAVLEATTDFVGVVDAEGRVLFVNGAGRRMLDIGPDEELAGLPMPQPFAPSARDLVMDTAVPAAVRDGAWSGETALLSRSGREVPVSQVIIAHKGPDGSVDFFATMARDITDRKRIEGALRESEERFRNAFENAPIGMALVGLDGRWIEVNGALCAMLGRTLAELLGTVLPESIYPDDALRYDEQMRRLLRKQIPSFQIEVRCLDVAGNDVYVLLSVSLIHDAAGVPVHLIAQFQNISDLKRSEAQLARLADHDPLTDLFNRRRFQAELERELARARRPRTRGAVVFLDLDHFKDVNDTLGHRAGDELLRSLGAMLRERLRKTDILARLGGDEFGILLPNTDAEQAQVLAEHLLLSLRHHSVLVEGKAIGATASGGIAVYPDHGLTVDEIVTHADLAMYQAKENGRNGCRVYTVELGRQAEFELRLDQEQRIRQALEEDLFLLYAQPILALATRQVSQYEVLLRLPNADGQVPPTAAFLQVAERCGLIHDIDRWVLRRAIGLLAELQAAGAGLALEVNLSGRAFADSKLLAMIQGELAASGINPRSLVLEITETAAIADIHQAREFIQTLKGLGCRFAIDDFGVGFSSFDYLKHLPVDYLKIDGSFVRNLLHDPVDQHLVRSMAQVAAGLGMQTIAEYVGDGDTLELLMQYGVDYAQGFHIGRPQPVAQLLVPILGGPKPVV